MSTDTQSEIRFMARVTAAVAAVESAETRRRALFEAPAPEAFVALNAIRHQRGPTERAALWERLAAAAPPLNLQVGILPDVAAAGRAIAQLVHRKHPEWGSAKSVVAWKDPLIARLDLDRRLADLDVPLYVCPGETAASDRRTAFRRRTIGAFVGVTAADYLLADTATLVMKTRPGCARMVSLVPSIHVAVVPAARVLGDLKELYAVLKSDPAEKAEGLTTCMTFITGPSKTADIEATLVHGAHGPREVHILVIDV